MYRSIDQEKTGIKIKEMLNEAGYDVNYVQEYLHLACPQSIYRWFKGKILPSVEHLCALSRLLGVHMEELLVLENNSIIFDFEILKKESVAKSLSIYLRKLAAI